MQVNAIPTYLDGWSLPEANGTRWSVGTTSSLKIDASALSADQDIETDVIVQIGYKVYIPSRRGLRTVSFLINGIPVEETKNYSYSQIVELRFPATVFHLASLRLEIICSEAGSPHRNGESTDVRELGLSITSICLLTTPRAFASQRQIISIGNEIAKRLFPPAMHANPWENATILVDRIKNAIVSKTPFSMVRLGDGEGRILGFQTIFSPTEVYHECIRYQFGPRALELMRQKYGPRGFTIAVEELRDMTINAIRHADVVGIPSPVHFSAEITNNNINGLRGFASTIISYLSMPRLSDKDIVDTYIVRGIHQQGGFHELIGGLDYICILTHTDITDSIKEVFKIRNIEYISIPGHQSFMAGEDNHYPVGYIDVLKRIVVRRPGDVFLVGAGYMGKTYCAAIKERGGIALDIGALFDGWSGRGRTEEASDERLRLQAPRVG